jgi:ADP-ribosylglycohydrolase/catechol 2,3-dioxygenase-like lactoylglutathione lyase family enzyme
MTNERQLEAARGAMLALAVGDALGWPLEGRSNRVGGTRDLLPELALRPWVRREGGGYAPHEEPMPAGVYSDDTQLTLAVARSLRYDRWWEYLTQVEIPWWSQYELGGGGATKRAARAWAKGTPPWGPSGAKGYWTAGGNGAAMRVLAHCIRPSEPFDDVRRRVLADGAATHGDPLALIGSQLYAFALWTTMRRSEPLGWGQLLEETLSSTKWTVLDPDVVPCDWSAHLSSVYLDRWDKTVQQTIGLLSHARNEMAHGALAVDDQVLRDLGLFAASGGAGTITALGALYLASRHAADPEQGILRAAFARGADTDTLAAMTGALLGAVHGPYWLGRAGREIMDVELLNRALIDEGANGHFDPQPFDRPAQKEVEERLADALPGMHGYLPFYGETEMLDVRDLDNRTSYIRSWWFRNAAGQTFRIKRTSRAGERPWRPLRGTDDRIGVREQPNGRIRSGLVVRVNDIDRARDFYESVIGMPVSRQTRSSIVLGGWLALEPADADLQTRMGLTDTLALAVTLFAQEDQFQALERRLEHAHVRFEVDRARKGPILRTHDPDGTPIEIRLVT